MNENESTGIREELLKFRGKTDTDLDKFNGDFSKMTRDQLALMIVDAWIDGALHVSRSSHEHVNKILKG